MKIENNIIYFKSKPMYFDKEMIGVKRNTVRVIDDYRELEQLQSLLMDVDADISLTDRGLLYVDSDVKIHITNTESGEYFERALKDISTLDVNGYMVFIFSW